MSGPWWKSLARILWLAFSRVWAPLMAVGWPLLSTYGFFQPHALDLDALRLGRGEVAVLVGSSSAQRSYVVLPRALSTASVSVVDDASGSLVVTKQPGAALTIVAIWIGCVYCTWYFWIRSVPQASNKRLERP
jgi:hypothetical protein